ncbi:MAG: SRPBCC family protein [Thermocrispum sp.]
MIKMEHSVVIDRPAEEVFGFVADQANESKWHKDVLEAHPQRPLEMGASVTWLIRFMGKSSYVVEVTAFEPPRRIELTTREGPLKPVLTHTFEPVDGATRYQRRVQIPLDGMFRLVGPIMKVTGAAHRRNARWAENLKSLLELESRDG